MPATDESAVATKAPSAPNQILRACAVEMHFEDFERHECTVNSNELAARKRFETKARAKGQGRLPGRSVSYPASYISQ